ncbi:MAG: TIGR01244 family sulfur transferase [Alphaproteobacteria bacterium]
MPVLKRLSDQVRVGPQLSVEDVAALGREGVAVIINNRPDGEAFDQPTSAEIEAAAEQAGIAYRHIPVAGGAVTPQAVRQMADALDEAEGPAVAFCRSGNRSSMLWALAQAGRQPAEAIIAAARDAGYDVSALRPYLEGMDPSPR